MAIDQTIPRSRRAVLGAALGGAAAAAAAAAAAPLVAQASDGDFLVLGNSANSAGSQTVLTVASNVVALQGSSSSSGIGLRGTAALTGAGVEGQSDDGFGVRGISTTGTGIKGTSTSGKGANGISTSSAGVAGQSTSGNGVEGTSDSGIGARGTSSTSTGIRGESSDTSLSTFTNPSHRTGVMGLGGAGGEGSPATNTDEVGVYGFSAISDSSTGVWGDSVNGTGVYGTGATGVSADGGIGVYGTGTFGLVGDVGSDGVGVYGFTGNVAIPEPPTGIGVYARAASTSQLALRVDGRMLFNHAGRKTVGSTSSSVKVTMTGVTSSSYVLATLQTNISGLYVRGVVCTTGSFTIYLSKAPGKAVYVAYMVIN